jgi:CO/xanthine dehydrogenase FAD-binding subunit
MSYFRPATLDDALAALSREPLTILAGGTDFYPARVGGPLDDDVLDISAIAALRGIVETDDHFRIGALTSWADLIAHPLPPLFDGLKLAAREIGGVQIQNAGTVAGNICNASPAADGAPPLLTLDTAVELASVRGSHLVPLAKFIMGNRQTRCGRDEIVTALRIAKPRNPARGTFLKLGARKYLVISIAMVAAAIEAAPDGAVAGARIAVGACSPVARRLMLLERALVGEKLSPALADIPTARHLSLLAPIDDVRGSAEYRRDAALTLVRRALARLGSAQWAT